METQMLIFLAMCSAIGPKELIELCGPVHPDRIRYALVKYGGGIIQMSGSIAGNTFARNRFGNYSRARTKPVNPKSSRQSAVRAAVMDAAARWSGTLTALQRAAWNLYASNVAMLNKLGETIHLTGFNHYVRSASLYIRNGNTPVDDGPVDFTLPDADGTFAFTGSEATQQLSITFDNTELWANEDVGRMFIFQGRPQGPTRNFFDGPWRYVHSLVGSSVAPPASPAVSSVSFAIAEGQSVWLYARIMRADGRVSNPFRDDSLILA